MARRGWNLSQWNSQSQDEQLDALAYERRRDEYRSALLGEAIEKIGSNDISILAQLLVLITN